MQWELHGRGPGVELEMDTKEKSLGMVGPRGQRPGVVRVEAAESEGRQEAARGSKKGQVRPESRDTHKVRHRGVRQEGLRG